VALYDFAGVGDRGEVLARVFHPRRENNLRLFNAETVRDFDCVLHNLNLLVNARRDVHPGVGENQQLVHPWVFQDGDMRQPTVAVLHFIVDDLQHSLQEGVSLDFPFEDEMRLPFVAQAHRLAGSFYFVRRTIMYCRAFRPAVLRERLFNCGFVAHEKAACELFLLGHVRELNAIIVVAADDGNHRRGACLHGFM
jgi:hypothetical protein